jgi:hypothetical protein
MPRRTQIPAQVFIARMTGLDPVRILSVDDQEAAASSVFGAPTIAKSVAARSPVRTAQQADADGWGNT